MGKFQTEIVEEMDAEEFRWWVAFDALKDEKLRKKIDKELALEESAQMTDEERAIAIKNMFNQIGGQ